MDLDEIEERSAKDFRRANGAPMVRRIDGSGKWDRYSRPSGWGDVLDDTKRLEMWRIDRAIEGVATTPSLAAEIAANIGREEGRLQRREKAIQIGRGEEASNLGTALHLMAERLETEEGFKAPPPYDADLAAYLMCLDKAGLVSEYVEVKVCSDTWRAAGTADRIYRATRELVLPDGRRVPPGTLFIGDLKTGNRLDYSLPGYAIQMAIYCDGCFYDVNTDERSPFPAEVDTGWGLLVHLPAGSAHCELLWCDLEVGRIGAQIVRDVRDWRKRTDFGLPFIYPESDEIAVMSQPLLLADDLTIGTANVDALGVSTMTDEEWMDAMLPFAQERINTIGKINEARALLMRKWPVGVPTIRQGGITTTQLAQVLDLLDAVEAEFSLPFPVDPRVEWSRQRGEHKSEMDVLNRNKAPSEKETKQ